MLKKLILVTSPWANPQDCYPFNHLFTEIRLGDDPGAFENAHAFILWGGTDIHPSFYNARANRFSQAPALPSDRDVWEWKAMNYCKAKQIPIIGICRGAQFMCAFAGGKLFQHIQGHTSGSHKVVDKAGEVFSVTSAHHQMLDVHGVNAELVAWADHPKSLFYYGEQCIIPKHVEDSINKNTFKEPEIVFFPEIRGLAIQGHPE